MGEKSERELLAELVAAVRELANTLEEVLTEIKKVKTGTSAISGIDLDK